jgi:hypothetical protein
MKKRKTILEFIPQRPDYTVLSARVPHDLFNEVNSFRIMKEFSWNELITACLTQFSEEMKKLENKN